MITRSIAHERVIVNGYDSRASVKVSLRSLGDLACLENQLFLDTYVHPLVLKRCTYACDVPEVLSLIHTSSETNRDDLLQALAWVGTEEVQVQFSAFRLHPPAWRSELFVPPENYSLEAGWELTEDGRRRDLYFSTCFELIPVVQTDPLQVMWSSKNDESGVLCVVSTAITKAARSRSS